MNPYLLYLSGPMTGFPDHNYAGFTVAADKLLSVGYGVINPANFSRDFETWEQYVKRDLAHQLECDGVAVLNGWQESKGASLEVYIAHQIKMPVLTVERWIEFAKAYV